MLNHYEILNVKPSASQKEIKKAYRVLAKMYHPDTYKGDKSFAESKMQEINRAYDVLSNEELRKSYDITAGIRAESTVDEYRSYTAKRPNETNPYKTYNDMTRNVKYHQNRTGTYYDKEGYARANYTPYSEEEHVYRKKKDKFISMDEFISSKKWVWVLLIVMGGIIAVGVFLHLAMSSLDNTISDFKQYDSFMRYFN